MNYCDKLQFPPAFGNGIWTPELRLEFFMKMLEFEKLILEKLSFDKILFEKEFRKAVGRLAPSEISELRNWCAERFPFRVEKEQQTET